MEEFFIIAVGVPMILFMLFVAPTWLILHYRSKRQLGKGLSENDVKDLQILADRAEQMSERIKTLESILDSEHPQWREKV
ncbi:envelope stress response membrane protein PspB [Alteromonas sp. LMIT006]|jgi:phage shock protein B|uniref:envelope stress response membrane protein PspB n=1 Tax=Alteromonadaceae TaxID=72275 RepID=UPI0020CA713E|nr:envelope stress response membrane protein PspB [Alteromonas sp. LMIT006]UTP71721.1 envelope stress response membrane protein PspB [Alteromonas sp. LMIT006]